MERDFFTKNPSDISAHYIHTSPNKANSTKQFQTKHVSVDKVHNDKEPVLNILYEQTDTNVLL